MPTFAFRALGAVALLLSVAAAPAALAATITQTFSITQPFSMPNPPSGTPAVLVANSAFNVPLLPFVGSGLSSAFFSYTTSVSGTVTAGPSGGGASLELGVVSALEGVNFMGTGGSTGAGGAPNSVNPFSIAPVTGTRELLDSFGTSNGFPALLTGSEVVDFTFSNTSGPGLFYAPGPSFVALLAGSITLSGSLTFTFTGDGGLLSTDVPEPASLAVLGIGLVGLAAGRRRRAA